MTRRTALLGIVYFFPTGQYLRPHHIVEKWVSQSEAYQRQNDQCSSVVPEFRPIRSSFTRHIGPHRFPTQLLWIGSAHELTANVHAPRKPKYACTYALKTDETCIKELVTRKQDLSIYGIRHSFCHSLQWDTTTIFKYPNVNRC